MAHAKFAACGLMAALALSWGACGKSDDATKAAETPTHESLRARSIPLVQSVAGILKPVKDEASAKVAAAQITEVGKQLSALRAQDDKLPPMTKAEEDAMEKQMQTQPDPTGDDVRKEVERIMALPPNVSGPIMAAMKAVGEQMNK